MTKYFNLCNSIIDIVHIWYTHGIIYVIYSKKLNTIFLRHLEESSRRYYILLSYGVIGYIILYYIDKLYILY